MNKIRNWFFDKFKNTTHLEELKNMKREFKTFYNESKDVTEMTIYGVIGDTWWEDSTSASDIDFALKEITGDIVINLNSPGGDAFDGIAIYNRLKNHEGKVTVNVDGYACSAASVIAMSADILNMGDGAMIMIHEASTAVWGNKRDMRKQADILEELEEGMIDIYMTKANVSREEIRDMVDAETWLSASKAKEIGFATATETVEEPPVENTSKGSVKVEVKLSDELVKAFDDMRNEIQELENKIKNTNDTLEQPIVATKKRVIF